LTACLPVLRRFPAVSVLPLVIRSCKASASINERPALLKSDNSVEVLHRGKLSLPRTLYQKRMYRHVQHVGGLENGSFSYVVTNQVKVVAVGSQKLLPAADVLQI